MSAASALVIGLLLLLCAALAPHLSPAAPPPLSGLAAQFCIVRSSGHEVLQAYACTNPEQVMAHADNLLRNAAGLPLCWSTLVAEDLTLLPGLDASLRHALLELHARGVRHDDIDWHALVAPDAPTSAGAVASRFAGNCGLPRDHGPENGPDVLSAPGYVPDCDAPNVPSTCAHRLPTTPDCAPHCR